MSNVPQRRPLVAFATTFRERDERPSRLDARAGGYAEPEVVTAETVTLTDLFRRVEAVLMGRHPGCQKAITFDFTKRL